MDVEAVVRLVGSGNFGDVEQAWLAYVGGEEVRAEQIVDSVPIIDALLDKGTPERAESLAWAAIEALNERDQPEEALRVAKAFLLKLAKSGELKKLTADLYLQVYADREGLQELLEQAGVAGGRPPRRALRTLEVCLGVEPGSFVVHRDDDAAGRVVSIDASDWRITVEVGGASDTHGAVEFADRYALCAEDDHRVLLHFDPDRFSTMLKKEPATVIESILRSRGNKIDSDELKQVVSAWLIPSDQWTKWWTKARAAIKRSSHIKIEGRSPYFLEYVPGGHDFQEEFAANFRTWTSLEEQYAAIEGILRECQSRQVSPDAKVLGRVGEMVARSVQRAGKSGGSPVLAERLMESLIASALGGDAADDPAVAALRSADDAAGLIRTCTSAAQWRHACQALKQSHPESFADVLFAVFPWSPAQACDDLADVLDEADLPTERFEEAVNTIVSEGDSTFPSLCWLWDKGLDRKRWCPVAALTILTRILSVLGAVQRSEKFDRKKAKEVSVLARSALSARKYERFISCLDSAESGMAHALRTQIRRLDNLGRNVHEDLLNRIRSRFPELYRKIQAPIWEREDVIYATREGIDRWLRDIRVITDVKMRENAKAIGDAAAKGDLSENSEYKFALEERDLLRARLAQKQEQFSKARELSPEDVPADHISIGTKATLRHVDSGEITQLTFLSAFETDLHAHVYNYQAPLAQQLMGAHIGDRVESTMLEPAGTYEIVALAPWAG